jgi:hypothetical protein
MVGTSGFSCARVGYGWEGPSRAPRVRSIRACRSSVGSHFPFPGV